LFHRSCPGSRRAQRLPGQLSDFRQCSRTNEVVHSCERAWRTPKVATALPLAANRLGPSGPRRSARSQSGPPAHQIVDQILPHISDTFLDDLARLNAAPEPLVPKDVPLKAEQTRGLVLRKCQLLRNLSTRGLKPLHGLIDRQPDQWKEGGGVKVD